MVFRIRFAFREPQLGRLRPLGLSAPGWRQSVRSRLVELLPVARGCHLYTPTPRFHDSHGTLARRDLGKFAGVVRLTPTVLSANEDPRGPVVSLQTPVTECPRWRYRCGRLGTALTRTSDRYQS